MIRFLTSAQCQTTCIPLWPSAFKSDKKTSQTTELFSWNCLPKYICLSGNMNDLCGCFLISPKTIIMPSHPQSWCQEGWVIPLLPPTLHIPSLAFLVCYICIISRKTGKLPVEIVLILVSSLYLAISQNIKYKTRNTEHQYTIDALASSTHSDYNTT